MEFPGYSPPLFFLSGEQTSGQIPQTFLAFLKRRSYRFPIGDVLHGEQDHFLRLILLSQPPCVQQQCSPADLGENVG